ncbi:MAG TPA: hypothetical protein VK549_17790 [Acidimicrobiia bacterium]|nr:hypothetical protein [Acidimicrobiia bacterium]
MKLTPDDDRTSAFATADVSVVLNNTAAAEGLPQIVIGPYIQERFVAGENRTLLSMYSPLRFGSATVDGRPVAVARGQERNRNVYSLLHMIPAKSQKTTTLKLDGAVDLHDSWYTLVVRAQPTLKPDQLHVSVEVPEGWTIDEAPGMQTDFARRVSATLTQQKAEKFRAHLVPDSGSRNLWERLVHRGLNRAARRCSNSGSRSGTSHSDQ